MLNPARKLKGLYEMKPNKITSIRKKLRERQNTEFKKDMAEIALNRAIKQLSRYEVVPEIKKAVVYLESLERHLVVD